MDWTTTISVLIGAGSALLGGYLQHRWSWNREKQVKSVDQNFTLRLKVNEFQRSTLVKYQDNLADLMRASVAGQTQDLAHENSGGEWRKNKRTEPGNAQLSTALRKSTLLASRIRDENLRVMDESIREKCSNIISAGSSNESNLLLDQATFQFVEMNELIGQLLRTLDDEISVESLTVSSH